MPWLAGATATGSNSHRASPTKASIRWEALTNCDGESLTLLVSATRWNPRCVPTRRRRMEQCVNLPNLSEHLEACRKHVVQTLMKSLGVQVSTLSESGQWILGLLPKPTEAQSLRSAAGSATRSPVVNLVYHAGLHFNLILGCCRLSGQPESSHRRTAGSDRLRLPARVASRPTSG